MDSLPLTCPAPEGFPSLNWDEALLRHGMAVSSRRSDIRASQTAVVVRRASHGREASGFSSCGENEEFWGEFIDFSVSGR